MDKKLLEELLNELKDVRAGMHGSVDKRTVRRQLKHVIQQLEEAIGNDNENGLTGLNVLAFLGGIIEKLPNIIDLIGKLTKK